MNEIVYRELDFSKSAILNLYSDNEWTLYTDNPIKLFDGIQNSLYCYAAYDNKKLVGLIRVVGDDNTIIYIQDILILKEYQNKKIGTKLISHIISKYQDVRQIILTTDNSVMQKKFYEKNNFQNFTDANLIGFKLKK